MGDAVIAKLFQISHDTADDALAASEAEKGTSGMGTEMSGILPGWIVDDVEAVRLEAAPYRRMTVEHRQVLLAAACRAAAKMLRSREDSEDVLAYIDPLPASTKQALARLRREAKQRSGSTARDHV